MDRNEASERADARLRAQPLLLLLARLWLLLLAPPAEDAARLDAPADTNDSARRPWPPAPCAPAPGQPQRQLAPAARKRPAASRATTGALLSARGRCARRAAPAGAPCAALRPARPAQGRAQAAAGGPRTCGGGRADGRRTSASADAPGCSSSASSGGICFASIARIAALRSSCAGTAAPEPRAPQARMHRTARCAPAQLATNQARIAS